MAVNPGTYNFTLQRRSDWNLILQFKDSSNAAINLTGYTVYSDRRGTRHAQRSTRTSLLLTPTVQTAR